MHTKRHSKHLIALMLLIIAFMTAACSSQANQPNIEQIDQSKLQLVDESASYISWDDAALLKALRDWQANPSLYEPVGIMLSDRAEANGVSLEQTINRLHEDYEKLGVDSSYMAVLIEALGSEMKMFNNQTFELNLPLNPNGERVALNAVNIRAQDGYDYAAFTANIERYLNGEIDAATMDSFLEKMDMVLLISDSTYQKIHACQVGFLPTGQSDDGDVVKLIIDSGVDGAYFQILRKK